MRKKSNTKENHQKIKGQEKERGLLCQHKEGTALSLKQEYLKTDLDLI